MKKKTNSHNQNKKLIQSEKYKNNSHATINTKSLYNQKNTTIME